MDVALAVCKHSPVFRISPPLPMEEGGGGDPPRVSKVSVVELSGKKTADCSRRVLVIGISFFDPSSTFDPVMRGQRPNFRKIDNFSNLHAYIS